jgi:hypothetical protein
LLQARNALVQFEDIIVRRILQVMITVRLLCVYQFIDDAFEEGGFDIEMVGI